MAKDNFCTKGHAWTPGNTYFYRDYANKTRRKCKACTLAREARNRRNRRVAKIPDNKNRDARESMRVNRIAHLIDLMWQASTPWERADLRAEIAEIEKQKV